MNRVVIEKKVLSENDQHRGAPARRHLAGVGTLSLEFHRISRCGQNGAARKNSGAPARFTPAPQW